MREIDRRIIGELCRQRRIAKGLKQVQMSLPQAQVAKFERGDNDSLTCLDIILTALGWRLQTVVILADRVHDRAQVTWAALRTTNAEREDWWVGARRVAGEVGLAGYITWHVAVVLHTASEMIDG